MVNCRGRNGWFKLKSWRLWFIPASRHVSVELNSAREGSTAPVIFEGNATEMKSLLFEMIDQIDVAERSNATSIRIPYRG